MNNADEFDPYEKEQQLRAESSSWDTSVKVATLEQDIPVVDISAWALRGEKTALAESARQLCAACESTGFFSLTGHGVAIGMVDEMFAAVKAFHGLDIEVKQALLMDQPQWKLKGVGYLPMKNRKLPARDKGNLNEAFIVKKDLRTSFDDNFWPDERDLPGFRQVVENYAQAMEDLVERILPVFALALDMPMDFFGQAFEQPTYRLRMTHYPPVTAAPEDEFGIAPHVDTTFCTILRQNMAGLTIYNEKRQGWMRVPLLEDAFIVNSGELLRQWSNDRFLSVKHFANNNTSNQSRYSLPFFLNANADYVMNCIPSCCDAKNPPKYPPLSYANSQAIAQGE